MMSFEVTEKLRGRACACSCFSSIFPKGSMTEGKNLNWGSLIPHLVENCIFLQVVSTPLHVQARGVILMVLVCRYTKIAWKERDFRLSI